MKHWVATIIKSQVKHLTKTLREINLAIDSAPQSRLDEIGIELPEKFMAIQKSLTYLKGKINVENNSQKPT